MERILDLSQMANILPYFDEDRMSTICTFSALHSRSRQLIRDFGPQILKSARAKIEYDLEHSENDEIFTSWTFLSSFRIVLKITQISDCERVESILELTQDFDQADA